MNTATSIPLAALLLILTAWGIMRAGDRHEGLRSWLKSITKRSF